MMRLALGELADSSCCGEDMVQLYWAAVPMLVNVSATTGKAHRNIQETLRQALLSGRLGRHGREQDEQYETGNELKWRQNHAEQRAKAKNSRYYKYK